VLEAVVWLLPPRLLRTVVLQVGDDEIRSDFEKCDWTSPSAAGFAALHADR